MEDGWGKWLRESFDKFILLGLFIGQVSLVVWLIEKQTEQGYINWAQNLASTVLGTLLGLITGKLMHQTNQSTNTAVTQAPGGGDPTVSTSPAPSVNSNSDDPISGKEIS